MKSKLCNSIIGKHNKTNANGADKLREIVEWLNNRPEILNENKSHLQLIKEFNNIKNI